jgi:hypothetical protein
MPKVARVTPKTPVVIAHCLRENTELLLGVNIRCKNEFLNACGLSIQAEDCIGIHTSKKYIKRYILSIPSLLLIFLIEFYIVFSYLLLHIRY